MSAASTDLPLKRGTVGEQIVELLGSVRGAMRKNAIFDRLETKPTFMEFNVAFDKLRSERALVQDNVGGMIVYRLPKQTVDTEAAAPTTVELSPMARQRQRREASSGSEDATEEPSSEQSQPGAPVVAIASRRPRSPRSQATGETVMSLLAGGQALTSTRIAAELGASQSYVWRLLQTLLNAERVEQVGKGCKSRWQLVGGMPAAAKAAEEQPVAATQPVVATGVVETEPAGPSARAELPPLLGLMLLSELDLVSINSAGELLLVGKAGRVDLGPAATRKLVSFLERPLGLAQSLVSAGQ